MADQTDNEDRGLWHFIRGHTEVFVSLAALVTAVAAVIITMEQTKVMREEAALERRNARISVMPSVWLGTHIGEDEDGAYFRVVMTNKGLGPAVLETFAVTYKGEPVQASSLKEAVVEFDAKLAEGCKVTIILADKVANDFYIPPEEPFKAIGALPGYQAPAR